MERWSASSVTTSTSTVTARDGVAILRRHWRSGRQAKGRVLLVHGLGEHSGRYEGVGRHLAGAGYDVHAFDLRGHGRSGGRRGDTRFAAVFADLDDLLAELGPAALPVFLYGHSLGGLLALAYTLDRRPAVAGVVASGPALHTMLREQRLKAAGARFLGGLLPWLTVRSGLDDRLVTRDPAALAAYRADPLVHDRVSLALGRDGLLTMDRVLAAAASFPAPLLILHGGADALNLPSGSRAFAAASPDATLNVYDGVLHEPHHDPEAPRVLADVVAWLDAVASRPAGTA